MDSTVIAMLHHKPIQAVPEFHFHIKMYLVSLHIMVHVNVAVCQASSWPSVLTVKAPHIHKWKLPDETGLNFKHVRSC